MLNSLAPGTSQCDSKNVIFNLVLLTGIFRSSHDNALRWMPQDLTDDKSTLVQVMAWCRQTTSHYLSQCWLSSLSPHGVTRPKWVDSRYCSKNITLPQWHTGSNMTSSIIMLMVPMSTIPLSGSLRRIAYHIWHKRFPWIYRYQWFLVDDPHGCELFTVMIRWHERKMIWFIKCQKDNTSNCFGK